MSRLRNLSRIRLVGDGDIAYGVKEFDRHLQFLLKKFAHVRHARAAATEVDSRGRFALLLRPIMTDGPHNFSMKARHGAPNDFRHSRYVRIRRIGVSTPETDEAALSFARFGGGKRLVEFFCQRRRHRATANWHAARKNLAWLYEEQIGGASADIDYERRIGHIAVVITKGVVERHVRDPDHHRSKPRRFYRGVDSLKQVGFDRDQDNLQLFIRSATDELIIPHIFVNRERHVLLR